MRKEEERFRDVHGGVTKAWTLTEVPCNAYCKPPIHCDLWYTQRSVETVETIQPDLYGRLGPWFETVDVIEATEAPPKPPEYYLENDGIFRPKEPIFGWLVFWRLKEEL